MEGPEFEASRGSTGIPHEKLDRVMDGICLSLCRNPERYPILVEGTGLRGLRTEAIHDIPSLFIRYVFDDVEVTLLHVERASEESDVQ